MEANISDFVQKFCQLSRKEKVEAFNCVFEQVRDNTPLMLLQLPLLNIDQNKDIRSYIRSQHLLPWTFSTSTDLHRPLPVKTSNSCKRSIYIKEPVPLNDQIKEQELDLWSKSASNFWSLKSHLFIPENTTVDYVRSVLRSTIQFQSRNYRDYLRRRFIAVFWFDYFKETYPNQKSEYDSEYERLASRYCNSEVAQEPDKIVKCLCTLLRAGRRYAMLAERFGEGILLTLLTSIPKTTLEKKLPLKKKEFDLWSEPIRGSKWHKQAQSERVQSTGKRIRRLLIEQCGNQPAKKQRISNANNVQQEHSSPTATTYHFTPPSVQSVEILSNFTGELETIATPNSQRARQPVDTVNIPKTRTVSVESGNPVVAATNDDAPNTAVPDIQRSFATSAPGEVQTQTVETLSSITIFI
ncbi:hypothetical protein B0O99DRAFT_695779 [Bisporella sp. PMI_857]|nr:hypothetical protein B0O99DRAFT_695779 [Bisporella sp. PMI_857]